MGGRRKNAQDIFDEYFYGKQTYAQLAEKYGCSEKTIRRYIDKVNPRRKTDFGRVANVVMDTTYFGKEFSVMVFKNTLDGLFADLKNKLRNHNGLSTSRKKKLIDEFFKA